MRRERGSLEIPASEHGLIFELAIWAYYSVHRLNL